MPRGLIAFWVVVIGMACGGIAYLQYLGPLPAPLPAVAHVTLVAAPRVQPPAPPMPPPPARIALMVSDLGDDEVLSLLEAASLPAPVAIAISPYGSHMSGAVAALHGSGHALLLLLPMPGLIATAPAAQNQATLDWSLSQFQGFTGATDAYGPAMGGGFMDDIAARTWLLGSLTRKNLYFIDGRAADVVLDGQASGDSSAPLALLVKAAQNHRTAFGVLVNPTPAAVTALALWSRTLSRQNIILVPVGTLISHPTHAGSSP